MRYNVGPLTNWLEFLVRTRVAEGFSLSLWEVGGERMPLLQCGDTVSKGAVVCDILFDGDTVGEMRAHSDSLSAADATALADLVGQALAAQMSARNSQIRRKLSSLLATVKAPKGLDELPQATTTLEQFIRTLGGASDDGQAWLRRTRADHPALDLLIRAEGEPKPADTKTIDQAVFVDGLHVLDLSLASSGTCDQLARRYDERLLRHAAANLGAIFSFGSAAIESATREARFGTLLGGFHELYREAYGLLDSPKPLEQKIDDLIDRALQVSKNAIPTASILDVRWLYHRRNQRVLRFRRTLGQAWATIPRRLVDRSYPVDGTRKLSKGARVFLDGNARLIRDVREDDDYVETFPTAISMVIAPISVEAIHQGVLDIRSESSELTQFDLELAEAVGRQLGLLAHLLTSIVESRRSRAELQQLQNQQLDAFKDLRHQLVSPITQLERRTDRLTNVPNKPIPAPELYAVRGLARKAFNVTRSLQLFVDLSRGVPLQAHLDLLSAGDLVRTLSTAARDAEIVAKQPVRIYLDEPTISEALLGGLKADSSLLEQAVASLLDNAGKYAFPDTEVDVWCTSSSLRSDFVIAIRSTGQEIRGGDLERCKERGWRGATAYGVEVAGEGSGTGLWIVDQIMLAHGGHLTVSANGYETTVRMRFPSSLRS